MPPRDPGLVAEAAYVAEQARRAKAEADRAENEARIREQVECDPQPGPACKRCGDPYAGRTLDEHGVCDLCRRDAWADAAKAKLSPEELYPEHFPDPGERY